jgi:hypothetical protein
MTTLRVLAYASAISQQAWRGERVMKRMPRLGC